MAPESALLSQLVGGPEVRPSGVAMDWAAAARELQVLARARTRKELLEAGLRLLTERCHAEAAAIWLYEAEHLELAAERGLGDDARPPQRRGWTDLHKLPLNSGGLLVGVMETYSRVEGGFGDDQKSAFQVVGATLANALHRERLATQAASAEGGGADRQRLEEVEMLARVWQATSHALNYPSLFEALLNSLGDEVPYDAAALLLTTEERPQCHVALRRAGGKRHLADLCQRAVAAYRCFGGPSVEVPPEAVRVLSDHPGEGSDEPLQTGFGVPLIRSGEPIGLIYVAAVDPEALTERLLRILYAVAAHATASMERVRELLAVEVDRLKTIIESLPQGVVLLDDQGGVLLANQHGRKWLELLAPDANRIVTLGGRDLGELLDEAISSGIDLTHHEVELRACERTYDFDITIVPARDGFELVGSVLSIHDISHLRQTEQRLYHDARLASIGEFASGLAHELNNPMMILLGLAEVLQDSETDCEERRNLLREVQQATLRAADIVKQLMIFADTQRDGGWDTLHLREVLEQAIGLVKTQYIREGVDVDLQWADDLPPVQGDAGKLQQVVLGLLRNAYEAIVHSGSPGRIVVRTGSLGDRVWVEVDDDGPGVPPELRETIFDVFFTTKRDYQGKGLGLSIAYRIAQEHQGTLTLEESSLGGARFRLTLPRHEWRYAEDEPPGDDRDAA